MGDGKVIEITFEGNEIGAHEFFHRQQVELTRGVVDLINHLDTKARIHTGKGLSQRQINTVLLANKDVYKQIGNIESIMTSLRGLQKK